MTASSRTPATGPLDASRLATWLDTTDLPGRGAPIDVRAISGGSQNEIFEIRRGDLHCALRKPPLGAVESRNEGILREWRIIEALDGSDVPHTKAVGVCTDPSVLGGTFYLMGFVDGWSPINAGEGWPAPFTTDLEARRGLAFELVRGVARMAAVDWRSKPGLVELGRPDSYHDRQVDRWMRFYERVRNREVPGLDVATEWLRRRRPIDFVPGLMHGDYQFANVMYHHGLPARLAAIIDWEMGTIGDPKVDLAWVLQMWPDRADEVVDMAYVDLNGMPSRDELVADFVRESGRQCDDLDYYLVLARWKLAIVLEQGYARAVEGAADEKLLLFGNIVTELMRRAANLAETSDYPETVSVPAREVHP